MNVRPSGKAHYSGRVQRALLLSAVFFCSVLSARSQIQLPEGESKHTVETVCTLCHELDELSKVNLNRADWGYLVERMVAYGAPLPKDKMSGVAEYLAQSFPGTGKAPAVKITGPVEARIGEVQVPYGMRAGDNFVLPDGTMWFTGGRGAMGRYDPNTGEFKKYPINFRAGAHDVEMDQEGNVWFVAGEHVGKLNPNTGGVTEYAMPDPKARSLHDLVIDPKGSIFFTMSRGNMVGRLNPKTGEVTLAAVPTPNASPYDIQVNSKGIPFFTEFYSNKVASIDPDTMEIREYALAHPGARPKRLGFTPDDIIWYNDYARGYIGRLDPKTGETKEWPLPGGRRSEPYGFTLVGDIVWTSETNTQPPTLVRFDTKTEKFQTWLLPNPGDQVHDFIHAPDGKTLWIGHQSAKGSVFYKVEVH